MKYNNIESLLVNHDLKVNPWKDEYHHLLTWGPKKHLPRHFSRFKWKTAKKWIRKKKSSFEIFIPFQSDRFSFVLSLRCHWIIVVRCLLPNLFSISKLVVIILFICQGKIWLMWDFQYLRKKYSWNTRIWWDFYTFSYKIWPLLFCAQKKMENEPQIFYPQIIPFF